MKKNTWKKLMSLALGAMMDFDRYHDAGASDRLRQQN